MCWALKGSMQGSGIAPLLCLSPPGPPGQVWQDLMTLNLCNEWHLDSPGELATAPSPRRDGRMGGVTGSWTPKRLSFGGGQKTAFAKPFG